MKEVPVNCHNCGALIYMHNLGSLSSVPDWSVCDKCNQSYLNQARITAKNLEEVPTFELMDEMASKRMTLANDPNDVCGYWFISTGTNEQMLDSCVWHDKAYTENSWAQANLSRKEVDQWFYQQMLLIAGDNTIRRLKAKAFYVVARVFGFLLWEGKR